MAETGRNWEPADTVARRAIVETLDRPLVVEAGAGTGKTTLLVTRLVHALQQGAIAMPGVVAITFTEKAAAELRLRLRAGIEAQAARLGAGDPAHDRLRRAFQELHRAQVSTIHAFAAAILRERPAESRLDPQFRVLDELESLQLQREVWRHWRDAELESETGSLLESVLRAGVELETDLRGLAVALYENRDLVDAIRLPAVPADLEERMRRARDAASACLAHAERWCRDPADRGLAALRRVAHSLQALEDLPVSSWPIVFLQELQVGAQAGKRDAWAPGAADQSKAERRRLQQELAALRQDIAHGVLGAALGWLHRFLDAYAEQKRRTGVLDFQDLLLHACQLLRADTGVRRELGERIGMLCVDEFQDTDPLQAEIVFFLAEAGRPAPRWEDVRVGPKLLLVGDPRQSIYRFRRADLDVYARCCEIVRASGGAIVDIVQNFRSRSAILDWVNAVFARLFTGGDVAGLRHVPLAAVPGAGAGPPALWVVQPAGAAREEAGVDAWRREEADALVRFLQHALAASWPVRTGDGVRPLQPGDIALLFARTSGIEHYEDALRAARLPFRQEGGKLFFQRQEVRDVLHALAAIDDPHDELAIVSALRSPLFGATDEDLWLHRARAGGFDYLRPCPESPLAAGLGLLAQLHRVRQESGVAAVAARLLDATGARTTYRAQPHGERALTNLETLLRRARRLGESKPIGLREFVRALRDLEEEPPKLAEWAPEGEHPDQVRMLTVHVAKGLEFPCVVLANLSARGASPRPPLVADRRRGQVELRLGVTDLGSHLESAGFDALARRDRELNQAEERRLLYVAATRARDYLVVGGFGPAQGLLGTLQAVPGALGDAPLGELGEPARPGRGRPEPGACWCVVSAADLEPIRRPAIAPARADVEGELGGRRTWEEQQALRLRRGAAGSGRIATDPDRFAPGAASDPDAAAHAVLERMPGRDNSAAALDALVGEIAGRVHVDPGTILPWMTNARSSALESRAAAATRLWRGTRVVAAFGDIVVESILDLVFEEEDGCTLVDYTTDSAETDADRRERDLVLRALVLSRAGRTVREAGSFFLRTGHYVPLPDLPHRMDAMLRQLETKGQD